jgi:beta-N-acetylhexosaminidase
MNFRPLFAVALLVLSYSLFSLDFFDNGTPEELAAAIEQAMTDDQALAQVFMLGWVGAEPSPLIMDWIHGRNIGGVKIFGWNTEDTTLLARTVGALQEASLQGPF